MSKPISATTRIAVSSNEFRKWAFSYSNLLIGHCYIRNIVVAHLDQCFKETSNQIHFFLKVEMEPSTRNTNYFKDYRRKFLSFFKGLFHEDSNDHFVERIQGRVSQSSEFARALDTIMANLPKIGFHSMTPLELGVLQTSEESDEALRIMADVRAYFQGTSLVFFSLLPLIKI